MWNALDILEVSTTKLQWMKEQMDANGIIVLSAAPKSGKSWFSCAMEEYLRDEGETVISISMGRDKDWRKGDEEEFENYFKENSYSGMPWGTVLNDKASVTYLLLDDAHAMYGSGSAAYFWTTLHRINEEKLQHGQNNLRILLLSRYTDMNILPENINIYEREFLLLSREETRLILEKALPAALDEHQHEVLYRIASGHPRLLKNIISKAWQNLKIAALYKDHTSFVRYMTSHALHKLVWELPHSVFKKYEEKEEEFLMKMLLESEAETGVLHLSDSNSQTKEIVRSLKSSGVLCEAGDGVQFCSPIFQIIFGCCLQPQPPLSFQNIILSEPKTPTFNELVETCLRHLQTQQLKKLLEMGTERARRELVISFLRTATFNKGIFWRVVPFVGSTFGSSGYSLDIQVDGESKWAFDVMHGDGKETPPHIKGFVNGGFYASHVEKWAIIVVSYAPPDQSKMENNHWYIHCNCDCTSSVVRRKDCDDLQILFGCNDSDNDLYH